MNDKNKNHTHPFTLLPNGKRLDISKLSGRGKTRFFVIPNIERMKKHYGKEGNTE